MLYERGMEKKNNGGNLKSNKVSATFLSSC